MDLSNLKPAEGSTKSKKRIGRGQGSGHGGTSTRGHKGQKSRSGYSKKVGFEVMFRNYLTHKDIASLTGTSRQTVTTVLNDLKEKNLINFDRRRFLIRDIDKLK